VPYWYFDKETDMWKPNPIEADLDLVDNVVQVVGLSSGFKKVLGIAAGVGMLWAVFGSPR
jgi:hypothetical protein